MGWGYLRCCRCFSLLLFLVGADLLGCLDLDLVAARHLFAVFGVGKLLEEVEGSDEMKSSLEDEDEDPALPTEFREGLLL